jgi:hypothetical protein
VYPQIQIRKTPPYFIILIVCSWCDDDETLEACREVMDFSLFQKEKYFWITPMNLASEFWSIEYFKDNDKHMIYYVHT